MKKKKKLRIKLWVVCILFLLCFLASTYFLVQKNDELVKKINSKSSEKVEEVKEKTYEAKVFMVGDALIHSTVYQDAKVKGGYDFKPMLSVIKPISSKYDLAYYNQETILGGEDLGYSSYPRFNSPDEVGDAFIDAGFDLVSLATNHTMDKNEVGVLHSVNYWASKKNIISSGQWDSWKSRNRVHVYEKNGIRFAFLSYTTWTNGLLPPKGKEYLTNNYSDEQAKKDIEAVKDYVDVIMVAMHWGTEYSLNVSAQQERIADYLSDLGVDLIIGAHPHVVEPVEYINHGKTFVIYSLGNFVSDQNEIEKFTGLAMEVTLQKKVDKDGKVNVSVIEPKAELIYTTTKKRGGLNYEFKVVPYPQLTNQQLPNYKSYYSKYKAVVSKRYEDLTWGLTWE